MSCALLIFPGIYLKHPPPSCSRLSDAISPLPVFACDILIGVVDVSWTAIRAMGHLPFMLLGISQRKIKIALKYTCPRGWRETQPASRLMIQSWLQHICTPRMATISLHLLCLRAQPASKDSGEQWCAEWRRPTSLICQCRSLFCVHLLVGLFTRY